MDGSTSDGPVSPAVDVALRDGAGYLLFLGRISWKKGLDRFLRALAGVEGVRLVVAGSDDEGCWPALALLAGELGLERRVSAVGMVGGADKRRLLAGALALVAPSPYTLLHAPEIASEAPYLACSLAVLLILARADGRLVVRMLPAGVAGALLGTSLLARLSANTLRLALAVFVLLLVAYKLAGDGLERLRYQPRAWHAPTAGLVAGVASGMFNNGAPPFNTFLLLQKLAPRTFIATTALFFALLNLLKIPGFLYTGELNLPLLFSLWWVFIVIPLGFLAARWLVQRVQPAAFESIIVAMLLFSSLLLFWESNVVQGRFQIEYAINQRKLSKCDGTNRKGSPKGGKRSKRG